MDRDDPELENALQQLAGCNFYRDNIFRVTGLPTNATSAQIRRRREEASLAVRLGTNLQPRPGDLLRQPPPTHDELKAAFESLRNPVLRLVHEMLWLWQQDGDSSGNQLNAVDHDAAVRSHCMALEAEYASSSPESATIDITWLDQMWTQSLAAWAAVLSTEETWDWARHRVDEISDARLTTGTVRRLRTKLPLHIVAVNAALAARAAENGDDGAARHLRLLHESSFEKTLVERVLRTAVFHAEDRVMIMCTSAQRTVEADPNRAAEAASKLLDEAGPLLRVVDTLLGSDDPLTRALHDQVASRINECTVAYYKATDKGQPAVNLLRRAQDFARERPTIDLVGSNLKYVEEGVLVAAVAQLCEKGSVEGAAARLRAWRRNTDDDRRKEQLATLLSDPRALRSPISSAPSCSSVNGIGLALYGRSHPSDDDTYIATHFFIVLFFPVIPLAAYLRNSTHILARVPLSTLARWWQRLVLILISVSIVLPWGSVWAEFAVAALAVLYMLWREYRLRSWVSQRTNG
jgi:hypothetical protein